MVTWVIIVSALLMVVGAGLFVYSVVCDKIWAFGASLALLLIAQAIVHLSR
jgi:hypothetical protein